MLRRQSSMNIDVSAWQLIKRFKRNCRHVIQLIKAINLLDVHQIIAVRFALAGTFCSVAKHAPSATMLKFVLEKDKEKDPKYATKQKKKAPKGHLRHSMRNSFKASLGSGLDLKQAIKLPPDQNRNEWLAMHTTEMYNTLNVVCNLVVECCTDRSCPEMTAGKEVKYLWADELNPKPIDVTAPQYFQKLFTWLDSKFADDKLFPITGDFPPKFESELKVMLKRMFRCYAHIYHSHLASIKSSGSEAHLNTCFKHFMFFVQEFKLIDPKDLEPMQSFISKLPTEDRLTPRKK